MGQVIRADGARRGV